MRHSGRGGGANNQHKLVPVSLLSLLLELQLDYLLTTRSLVSFFYTATLFVFPSANVAVVVISVCCSYLSV